MHENTSFKASGKKNIVRCSEYNELNCRKVKITGITEVNYLKYCEAALVREMLGIRPCRNERKELLKKLLESLLKVLNKDLSRTAILKETKNMKE